MNKIKQKRDKRADSRYRGQTTVTTRAWNTITKLQYGSRPPSWILQIFVFGYETVTNFQICIGAPKFIKIGWFLSRVSTLTRDIDIAIRSVCPSVCP